MIIEYIALFLIYSFVGWVIESTFSFCVDKKFVNRGFMMGPVVPIYAIGGLLLTLLLHKYNNNIFVLFFMSVIICGVLEYFVSWLMEKLFHLRWWDYSNKKFNINGRICLRNLILFGIMGVFLIKISNPFLFLLINMIPINILNILVAILGVIFIIDFIVSCFVIRNLKGLSNGTKKDSTEDIKNKIKENNRLYNRLIKAFPLLTNLK